MPRSIFTASPSLELQLEPRRAAWAGGDVMTGFVSRAAPIVSPQAELVVKFFGRAKSKVVVQRGQSGASYYRGRYNFFDPEQHKVLLLSGPIHIPETGNKQSWQFRLRVPSALEPMCILANKNQQKNSFLPLDPPSIHAQRMPPTFYAKGRALHCTYEAYVEYFLQAELTTWTGRSAKTEIAVLPINLLSSDTPGPIDMSRGLGRMSYQTQLSSYRLVPGEEESSLTLGQRAQELFRSAKVPQLGFTLQVEYPRTLQIGNFATIPFRVHAIADPSRTSDSLQGETLPLKVKSFEIDFRTSTDILCRGNLFPHQTHGQHDVSLDIKGAMARLSTPIIVPVGPKSQPVDLGANMRLNLGITGAPLNIDYSPSLVDYLFPSLETYNITVQHRLKWRLELSYGDVSRKLSDEQNVVLLPLLQRSEAPAYTPRIDGPAEQVPTYEQAFPSSSKERNNYPDEKVPEKKC